MIKAIIFDCFGVIITDALQAIIDEVGRDDPKEARQIQDAIGLSNKGIVTPEASWAAIAEILGITYDEYLARIQQGEAKQQGVLDFIATLRPLYKIAMLSNASGKGIRRRFTPEELDRHFDVVVASGDIGFAKPEAQAYEITADRLGARLAECVMVDDREDYCMGARGVGMQAIRYQSFDQMKKELDTLLHGEKNL